MRTETPSSSPASGARAATSYPRMSDGELGNELGDRFAPDVADALERRDELLRRDVGRIAVDADAGRVAQEDLAEDPVQERPRLVDGDAPRPGQLERRRDGPPPTRAWRSDDAPPRGRRRAPAPRPTRDRPGTSACPRPRSRRSTSSSSPSGSRRDGEEAVEDDRSLVRAGRRGETRRRRGPSAAPRRRRRRTRP